MCNYWPLIAFFINSIVSIKFITHLERPQKPLVQVLFFVQLLKRLAKLNNLSCSQ